MEDAMITQDGHAAQPQAVPTSLVTADDLKREIGEWVVAGLNKDKMLSLAVQQINALNAKIDEQAPMIVDAVQVKESNRLLGGKNKALADAADAARSESKDEIAKVRQEAKEAESLAEKHSGDRVDELNREIASAVGDLAIAQKTIADKNKEISKLKGRCTRLEKKLGKE